MKLSCLHRLLNGHATLDLPTLSVGWDLIGEICAVLWNPKGVRHGNCDA